MTATATATFDPINVCRGCNRPTPDCWCDPRRRCPSCNGRGFHCIDDICHGKGYCMHEGGRCSVCHGDGRVLPERVLVVPDRDARRIREYLRQHPELQKDEYDHGDDQDPLLGQCYPAAEAWYHLNDCELDVFCLSWSDVDGVDDDVDATHWYLRESDGRQRWIDLAIPLKPPVDLPPYSEGTRRGFITGDEPSARTQQVLDAVRDQGGA